MSALSEHISADFPFSMLSLCVGDADMAYIDTNPTQKHQSTVVFLHGNPTSSYLWRNIIPHVQDHARCIAPDLIGMGASSKPDHFDSSFQSHARYLESFLSQVKSEETRIILVLHDWGSALGLDWARQHSDEIAGLVLMEFIHPWPSWDDIGTSDAARQLFQAFRDPMQGPRMLVDENMFIEKVLPGSIVRRLTDAEMGHYRAPFLRREDREPLYRFPNSLPIAGEPHGVHLAVEAYHEWLLASRVEKLFFWGSPGALILEKDAKFYRENLLNCRSVDVGHGLHYIQEDHPHLIGRAIGEWLCAAREAMHVGTPYRGDCSKQPYMAESSHSVMEKM
ncbi:hypothetical protein LTR56_018249 [Elasticomyces elasticus]|nr:hypothetical protein LTR56_018249 [Elasticomyces elasticus]KAK3658584.1 hypothetical protein LTR22_008937 [Elasticomyces elasticus]KAK4906783.1 hypothetical protein LTR49_024111 [Elasticomyces elasticus]KAK5766958.1 hypothetical protein LTS12_002722 [Elasticomyces elasticus]